MKTILTYFGKIKAILAAQKKRRKFEHFFRQVQKGKKPRPNRMRFTDEQCAQMKQHVNDEGYFRYLLMFRPYPSNGSPSVK